MLYFHFTLKMLERLIDIIESPMYNEIMPNLYLGSVRTLYKDEAFVASIDVVVSIVCPNQYSEEELRELLPLQCTHMYLGISDSEDSDMGPLFEPCYQFVQKHLTQGHRIFIHCVEGMSFRIYFNRVH